MKQEKLALKVNKNAGTFDEKSEGNKPPPKRFIDQSQAAQIARDAYTVINWYYDGGREAFPHEPKMWTVDKYFPYAEGEPLLADEPQSVQEIKNCIRKAKLLEELEYRYAIIHNSEEIDANTWKEPVN
jgi:hypothetical protein